MIQPGETEHLAVTINCGKLSGAFTRKITVMTNDPDNPKMSLACRGKILEGARVAPKVANFGRINSTDSAQVQKVILTRGDGGPIAPSVRPLKNESFTTKINEITPGEQYELVVTYSPPFDSSKSRTKIEIDTGVAESPVIDLHAYAIVKPHVVSQPRHVIIPPDREGDFVGKVSLDWSDGKSKHTLTGASASDPKWKVEVLTEGQEQFVQLTVPADYTPAPGAHHLFVKTDDPKAPSVSVPVSFKRQRKAPRSLTAPTERSTTAPPAPKTDNR